MRYLSDAHALIWFVDQDHLLSPNAHSIMSNSANDLLLSAATIREIGIKVGLQKLPLSMPFTQWMNKAIADHGLVILPITVEYIDNQIGLPHHHRDPFDRILASQAVVEGIPLLSKDATFDKYGVIRIWQKPAMHYVLSRKLIASPYNRSC